MWEILCQYSIFQISKRGGKAMMKIELIIHLVVAIIGALASGLPIAVKLSNAIKAKRTATTEAEKEKAYNEMLAQANELIVIAENSYKAFDKVMKAQNSSAGAMKKKSVMTDLQAFALSKGIKFDAAFWSEKIDEIVTFTKTVNAK